MPIDVKALGVDLLVAGALKYLLASAGLGFLYCRRELVERLRPTATGWFADADVFAMDIQDYSPAHDARRFQAGTPPIPSIYAGIAGIELMKEIGIRGTRAHVTQLNEALIAGVDELGGTVVTPRDPASRGALVAIRSTDEHALVGALAADGILTSSRDGNLRVSAHCYNTHAGHRHAARGPRASPRAARLMRPEEPAVGGHYGAHYREFADEVYSSLRRAEFGEDFGQNNWLALPELERFAAQLELGRGVRLLDVACGAGGPALHLAELTGCSVTGVDLEEAAIANATRLAAEAGLEQRARFLQADASAALPLVDGSCEAILCLDALNHLPGRPAVFADWARLLAPGGRLLFTDPVTVTGLVGSADLAIRSSIGYFDFAPFGEDERLLREAGLSVLAVEDTTASMAGDRASPLRGARRAGPRRCDGSKGTSRSSAGSGSSASSRGSRTSAASRASPTWPASPRAERPV